MIFEKGDKVKFLNDVGGGIVQEVDKKFARVLMDDGFEVPMLLAELIMVEKGKEKPAYNQPAIAAQQKQEAGEAGIRMESKEREVIAYEEPQESGKNPAGSLYFAIVPVKSNKTDSERFDLYIINDSDFSILFNLLQEVEEFFQSLKSGTLEAETKIFIRSFTRMDLNEFPKLKFHSIFLRRGLHRIYSPVQKDIHPDPKELFSFEGFSENDFFDEYAFVRKIFDNPKVSDYDKLNPDSIKALLKDKEGERNIKQEKREILPDTEEVDLHIHELVENYAAMSNGEILEIQMARFSTALEGALRSATRRIVFIHGVGNGKLKFEIRKVLDKKYPRLKYQDASFKEYGYGATMVLLKK